jgi:hypothetical protein
MFFSPEDGTSEIYVSEKLDVSWADAEQIAGILNGLVADVDPARTQ